MSAELPIPPTPTGMIDRFANGGMALCPEGTQTIADGGTAFINYTVLTQSASVQTSQLSAPEPGQARAMRITQPSATAQRFGLCQTIPNLNCQDLRSSPINASHRARFSIAAPARTMFAILEWDGTANASPADPINDWGSTSYTPGQFFKSSFTVLNYGYLAATANAWTTAPYIPYQANSGLTNLVYVVWTESTVAQNGTLDLGLWQLIEGAQPLDFEHRPKALEDAMAFVNIYDSPFWVNVFLYGAPNGTNDTTAIEAALTAAGTGGVIYLPKGSYIGSGIDSDLAWQTWRFDRYARLNAKAGTNLNLIRVNADDVALIDAHVEGTLLASDSAGISVRGDRVRLIRPYVHDTTAFGIYSDGTQDFRLENIDIGGQIGEGYFGFHYTITTGTADKHGPSVFGGLIDLSQNVAATTLSGGAIIEGQTASSHFATGVTYYSTIRMPANPATSAFGCLGMRYVKNANIAILTEGGSSGITHDHCESMAVQLSVVGPNFYCLESGDGSNFNTYWGSLDGSDRAIYGVNQNGGDVSIGNSFYLNTRGMKGRVIDATPFLGINFFVDQQSGTTINGGYHDCLSADLGLLANTGEFSATGAIFNGRSACPIGFRTRNANRYTITGGISEDFTTADISAERSDGGVLNDIAVVGHIFANSVVPFRTVLSGGSTLGSRIRIQGCPGFTVNGFPADCYSWKDALFQVWGTSSPEAVVTAGVGSIFHQLDGSNGSVIWIKSSGSGNTGWTNVPYYAEGSWTPSMTFSTPGDLALSAVTATGRYTRSGNRVDVEATYTFTPTFTTSAGQFRLTGLPFTAANAANGSAFSIRTITANFAWPAGKTQVTLYPVQSTTYAAIEGLGSGASPVDFAPANLTSGVTHTLAFSGNYQV